MNMTQRHERYRKLFALVTLPVLVFSVSPRVLSPFTLSVAAQTTTGSIGGAVTDPRGDIVLNATITIVDVNKNVVVRVVSTDSEGRYYAPQLPVGTYNVIVAAPNFKKYFAHDVVLGVGQSRTLDAALEVGNFEDTVNVTGANTELTETADVSGDINQRQIQNLPVVGRNFLDLALLQPGVETIAGGSFDPTKANYTSVYIGGQSGHSTQISIDGVSVDDNIFGGVLLNLSAESIQELQVVTATYLAEYGRSSGGLMNAVTKSGSNELHGSLFAFYRDDSLQAKGPFGGPSKPSLGQQRFGGTVGGPLKPSKIFYFASVERLRENGATGAGVRDSSRRSVTQSFARTTRFGTLLGARLDFNLRESDSIFARYALDESNGIDSGFPQGGNLQDASNFLSYRDHQHQITVDWAHTFNPSVVNQSFFSYLTSNSRTQPLTTAPQIVFPSINVGANSEADRLSLQRKLQVKDDLSIVRGNHNVKFGLNYEHVSLPTPSSFNLFGTGIVFVPCDFPGEAGCPNARSDAEIPVIFSIVNRQRLTDGLAPFGTRGILPNVSDNVVGLYGQDSFRVRPQLTLNFGLRWEYDSDFIGKKQTNPARPGRRKSGRGNAQPRIGGVWALPQIVIRMGSGLFFDQSTLETRQLELLADGNRLPIVRSFGGTLGNPFAGVSANSPPDIFVTSNELRLPYSIQTSFGVERLFGNASVSADFISSRGRRFPRRIEINRRSDGSRAASQFGSVIETQSIVKTATDQLVFKFNMRSSRSHGFIRRPSLNSSYTLSRMIDEANDPLAHIESISSASSARERGPSPLDTRHSFTFSGTFNLPGGILVAPLVKARSSFPFEIIQNHDFSEGLGAGLFRLPTLGRNAGNRQVRTGADVNRAIDAFNADPALVAAHGGPLAHVSPDLSFGRPYFSFDMRLSKRFQFGESATLELGGDALNLFNHINVMGAAASNSSGLKNNVEQRDFGKPIGETPYGVFGWNNARAFRLFARVNF